MGPVTVAVNPGTNSLSNLFPTRAVDLLNQGSGWVVTSKSDLPVFVPQSTNYLLANGERVNTGDSSVISSPGSAYIGQKRNKGFR